MKQSGAMFLVNREGRVLLLHPSGTFNRKAPWMPPKEEIEPGETALDAAKRAVIEELHLAPESYESVRELGPVTYKSKSKQVHCFIARYLGGEDDVTLDWENDMYGWFAPGEARRMVKEEYGPALERGLAGGSQ
jgi:predicted NUDIX family NTP pyrophosphohydrolase